MISLNNINFYHHPPPPKPLAHTLSSSSWKSYHMPSAPQPFLFSHPLPPKPPATVAALKNVPTQENSLVKREADLQADHQSKSQARNDLGESLLMLQAVTSLRILIITTAEADSGYLGGRSVSAVNTLPGNSDCLQLSLSRCEAEKQTIMIDCVPKHHNSQLPSPALSNLALPKNKGRARPGQHHRIIFKDLPSEAACCRE
ncbi:uncharacterized protein P174DRAFT_464600 [Aspergillus novofumigatus IBT 16806]|uniref:Uncharacterized protein n=1 Tax=Aspergillus novofumigatus (strain IBT 16806) TaxID=1392255 RepID=A0A2I1BU03_ASPN1|nr:uncharacterized protein P174DRAFT_464600 [Aspergillus novofumigatus IBT 16806]PKX88849.1 hypothetical protein P174DRAFT_464600 [Aspergillus novofumigatus IBT 16806]